MLGCRETIVHSFGIPNTFDVTHLYVGSNRHVIPDHGTRDISNINRTSNRAANGVLMYASDKQKSGGARKSRSRLISRRNWSTWPFFLRHAKDDGSSHVISLFHLRIIRAEIRENGNNE